jgi:dTDP-4-amino-4,6-dideoxygalactose transaminase
MKIPLAKPYLDKEDAQSAYDTILTGWVTQGPRVQEFEEKFANMLAVNMLLLYLIVLLHCI